MGSLEELKEKDFREVISGAAVIAFGAPWCQACHRVMPILAELSQRQKEKIKFYQMNVAGSPGIASKYGVMSLPNILIFKKGKVVEQIIGAKDKATYEKIIKKILA